MASPSSFRKAEARRFLERGFVVAAGLGLAAQPAFAQDVQDEPPASPPTEAAVPQSVEPLPEPVPVPSSLDELIPPEAVDDPENWATRGVVGGADPAAAEAPADPGQAAADNALSAQLDVFLPPPAPGAPGQMPRRMSAMKRHAVAGGQGADELVQPPRPSVREPSSARVPLAEMPAP